MRYLNVFVGGSIDGLENERNQINELVNALNVAYNVHSQSNPSAERTFITVSSFSNFLGQMNQGKINKSIQAEVDLAVFLIDSRDGQRKECVGNFTKSEIETVLQNNIPYEIFIKRASFNDIQALGHPVERRCLFSSSKSVSAPDIMTPTDLYAKAEADVVKILGKYKDKSEQVYYCASQINSVLPVVLRNLVRKRVEDATWSNDEFAYYTIEARLKEIYSERILSEKKKGSFDNFMEEKVYGLKQMADLLKAAISCKDKEMQQKLYLIGAELSDITKRYKPSVYGEHHYDYIRKVPFLATEFYFYLYGLFVHLVRNGKLNPNDWDPYRTLKRDALKKWFGDPSQSVLSAFEVLMSDSSHADDVGRFKSALFHCVSTNSTDLSQLREDQSHAKVSNRLIIDHTDELFQHLKETKASNKTAVYVLDNFGPEFVADFEFGKYLLKWCGFSKIIYCVKQLPIFVSDTTLEDVEWLLSGKAIDFMKYDPKNDEDPSALTGPQLEMVSKIFVSGNFNSDTMTYTFKEGDKEVGEMLFTSSREWHSHHLFYEYKEDVKGQETEKGKSMARFAKELFGNWNNNEIGIIIIKGDMNYRRLVGDKNYDYFDKIEDKVEYIEQPLLILRSLKSNVIVGVEEFALNSVKPNWKTSGEYGIIHFVKKRKEK